MLPSAKPLTHATIFTEELPPLVWDITEVLSRGDRMVLYGEFGSGKSWIALHMALTLAAGRPWFGYPTVPRRVLYIDEEMNPRTTWRRLKRLTMGMGLPQPVELTVLSRGGVLFRDNGAAEVLAWMSRLKVDPQVIFVDSMRRTLDGNENLQADVSRYWRNLGGLDRDGKGEPLGRTFVVVHHMNKPGEFPQAARHRASGSTDILAGSDASLVVEIERKGYSWISGVKARDAEDAEEFLVHWHGEKGADGKEDFQGPMYLVRKEEKRKKGGADEHFGKGATTLCQ